MHLKGPY